MPWAKYPGLHFLATTFLDTVAVPLLVTYYEAECLCIQMHFCFKSKKMSATHHTYNTHVKTKSLPPVIVAPVSGKEQSEGENR